MRRLKVMGEVAYYHLISRTVGGEYYLGDVEKEKLTEIIRQYSSLFLVELVGLCAMSNHFHLLVKVHPAKDFSDEEIKQRLQDGLGLKSVNNRILREYRKKLGDVSEYMRYIKQTFSRWYNRKHNRKGYFWGDRFKSVLIEKGEGVLNCLAYIDLNPIRAGLVKLPEEYRWSSIGYRVKGDNWFSFADIFTEDTNRELTFSEELAMYRKYLYECGHAPKYNRNGYDPEHQADSSFGRIADEALHKEELRNFVLPKTDMYKQRVRYFSDGLVIGSKAFIHNAYARFADTVIFKKDRNAHSTDISAGVFSLKRLIN
jgi:REP element-mobilizing transposase RayT